MAIRIEYRTWDGGRRILCMTRYNGIYLGMGMGGGGVSGEK